MSIVLAVYDPPLVALRDQLDAIADQTSGDWECVVVDDASTCGEVPELLRAWVSHDPGRRRLIERTTNGGIAAATNDGIDAARGEVIAICDHDDIIHPGAVAAVVGHFQDHPGDDVVYTDEQIIDANGAVVAGYHKPDYSPRRHLGHHYLAHLAAARRAAIGDLRVRAEFEPSQDYDFYLRVIERASDRGRGVGHLAEVLYSWRAISGSSALDSTEKPEMAAAVERCSQAALDRRGIAATAHSVVFDGKPTTSVMLELAGPTPSLAVVPINATTTAAEVNAIVEDTDAAVVTLSPDVGRFGVSWAAPLAREAARADVGVVGPRIVDDTDGTLLSAGRVVRPTLIDRFCGDPADAPGPWGAFFVAREVSAVAPWGMTVDRVAFDLVGGLNVDLGLDVAVAELCARLDSIGRATIWTPAAELRLGGADLDGRHRLLPDEPDLAHTVDADMLRAIERTPGLGEERYDLMGLSNPSLDRLDAYHEASVLLRAGRIDLVTSDVFDTVVTRPVATAADVFVELGRELELPAHVTPTVFAQARREAERRARQRRADETREQLRTQRPPPTRSEIEEHPGVTAPECTLDEIWSLMPSWVDPQIGRAAELDLEASTLRPIPEAGAVFRTAHELDIPVVLVSDVYLTGTQLTDLLGRSGVDMTVVSSVVTSADHRLGKAHGLLERVITDHDVEPARVLHMGDHEISDVGTAHDLGAHAIHVDIPAERRHATLPPDPLATWSQSTGTDLGISAAVRATLVGAGPLGSDPAFQFGAALAGPALAGFSRWVSDATAELGASHTHCLLREGATIADLMGLTAPHGPEPVLLHASRWVTMRAAVIDGTADELLVALARRADLTADHVASAFACDRDRVREVLGADRIPAGEILDACRAISDDDRLRSTIVTSASDLRSRVLRYLDTRLRLDDQAPLVLADVGWGATIQEGLTRILRAGEIEHDVVGLYFALSAPGEQRLAQGARMLSYLPNESTDNERARQSRAIAHHADTIERIMTPELGTLTDIDADGSPVCRDPSADPIPPTLAAAQRGVHAVTARLADRSLGLTDFDDARWSSDGLRTAFAQVLADTVSMPGRPLAETLGAWPHDDVAGTEHRSIAGAELATAVRYANVRDLDMLDPAGRSWVAGLAGALNPALSGQIAAAQAGIPIDLLAPESENGVARLAAFEIGSDLAAVQVGRVMAVGPGGWSVLRLAGPVASLRSIRFDAGGRDALVDVAHFAVRLTGADGTDPPRRDVVLTDDDITWVRGHPIDGRRFAQQAGGHLLIGVDPRVAPSIRHVEVTAAFRSWRLDEGDPLAQTPILRRLEHQRRRVRDAVRRRLV